MAGESQAGCVFCKIVAKELPVKVVRETTTTLAFQESVNPQAPTHVVVVPKAHHATGADLADNAPEVMAELMRETGKVAEAEGVDESGYRTVFNTGVDAGQTTLHAHAHVLGGRGLSWPPG